MKKIPLSEQIQNLIDQLQKEVKLIPLGYIYMTTPFSGFQQALQYKVVGLHAATNILINGAVIRVGK
jgi:hypothetical protein